MRIYASIAYNKFDGDTYTCLSYTSASGYGESCAVYDVTSGNYVDYDDYKFIVFPGDLHHFAAVVNVH